MTSFCPELGFPKFFYAISLSLIIDCLIENALCSDIICSRIAIGRDQSDGGLADSAYNKVLFFSAFLFFNRGKGETNEPLESKKTKHHIVKRNDKTVLNLNL